MGKEGHNFLIGQKGIIRMKTFIESSHPMRILKEPKPRQPSCCNQTFKNMAKLSVGWGVAKV